MPKQTRKDVFMKSLRQKLAEQFPDLEYEHFYFHKGVNRRCLGIEAKGSDVQAAIDMLTTELSKWVAVETFVEGYEVKIGEPFGEGYHADVQGFQYCWIEVTIPTYLELVDRLRKAYKEIGQMEDQLTGMGR